MQPRTRRAALAVCVLTAPLLALTSPASSAPAPPPDGATALAATETITREVFSPDGTIRTVTVERPTGKAGPRAPQRGPAQVQATVEPVEVNGPSSQKLDLVFVGDGYTNADLNTYRRHVRDNVDRLFSVEPFRSYRNMFNIYQVNVISPQSGVDHDPRGTYRDTALDMHFYCNNMQRLLCVDEGKATRYAAEAPGADQVIALANTTTYGGAGGDVATSSGGNASASQIITHELGHSIGGLADEYGGRGAYRGSEPAEPNASTYPSSTMRSYQVKWWRWLGRQTPDGGVVGTYQGAKYHDSGIYRPSQNSIMRTLGREFNAPSRETMIAAFHSRTGGMSARANTSTHHTLADDGPMKVRLQHPTGHRLKVSWRVDGRETGFHGTSLSPERARAAGLPAGGTHKVTATVTDPTPWVIDPEIRRKHLTRTFTWTVRR